MSIFRMMFALYADFAINALVCAMFCCLLPYLPPRRHRHSSFAVKGSVAPMSFYTYDVNPNPVLPSLPKNGTFWDIFPPTTTVEYAFLLTLCSAMQCIYISSGIAQNLVRAYKHILMVNGQNRDRFWLSASEFFLMMVPQRHFSLRCPKPISKLQGSGEVTVN